jgi:hypothetical protein
MSSEGRTYARFRRALDVRSVMQAEAAARELGRLGLLDALDYLVLLAAEAPDRYGRAGRRWLSRLLAESEALTPDEVSVAVGCLRGLAAAYGEQSRQVLRALVKRRRGSRAVRLRRDGLDQPADALSPRRPKRRRRTTDRLR